MFIKQRTDVIGNISKAATERNLLCTQQGAAHILRLKREKPLQLFSLVLVLLVQVLHVGWEEICLVFRSPTDTCWVPTDFLKDKPNPNVGKSHEAGGHRAAFCPWRVLTVQGRGQAWPPFRHQVLVINTTKIKQKKKKKEEKKKIFWIAWSVTTALTVLASGGRGRQVPSEAGFWWGGIILASSARSVFILLHSFDKDSNRTLNKSES